MQRPEVKSPLLLFGNESLPGIDHLGGFFFADLTVGNIRPGGMGSPHIRCRHRTVAGDLFLIVAGYSSLSFTLRLFTGRKNPLENES